MTTARKRQPIKMSKTEIRRHLKDCTAKAEEFLVNIEKDRGPETIKRDLKNEYERRIIALRICGLLVEAL